MSSWNKTNPSTQKDKRTKRLYGTFKVCEETIKDD